VRQLQESAIDGRLQRVQLLVIDVGKNSYVRSGSYCGLSGGCLRTIVGFRIVGTMRCLVTGAACGSTHVAASCMPSFQLTHGPVTAYTTIDP
jgi:hypothetical protein